MVGLARGVSGLDWAMAWLQLRKAAGCDATKDGCLMPEILSTGELGAGRMRTSDANAVLKAMFAEDGARPQATAAFTSHSAKATFLSWAAKAGMPRSDRRLLGGHADPRDRSMAEYSRDTLAKPLAALECLIDQIRDGLFDPDATRSGRWTRGSSEARGSAIAATHEDGQAQDATVGQTAVANQHDGEDGDCVVTDTSDGTSDSGASQEHADAAEAEVTLGKSTGYPSMPTEGIILCGQRGTIHRAVHEAAPLSACGFGLKFAVSGWTRTWPERTLPLCGRAACFPR